MNINLCEYWEILPLWVGKRQKKNHLVWKFVFAAQNHKKLFSVPLVCQRAFICEHVILLCSFCVIIFAMVLLTAKALHMWYAFPLKLWSFEALKFLFSCAMKILVNDISLFTTLVQSNSIEIFDRDIFKVTQFESTDDTYGVSSQRSLYFIVNKTPKLLQSHITFYSVLS